MVRPVCTLSESMPTARGSSYCKDRLRSTQRTAAVPFFLLHLGGAGGIGFIAAAIFAVASVKTMLFVGIFFIFFVKSSGSNDCSAIQEISCDSLRSSKGFTYTVPSNITCFSCNEQGWYFQNGTFIVDSTPNAGGKWSEIVVDVSPQNLTVSVCENLQWQLNCGTCMYTINFTVTYLKHSPPHDPKEEQDGNHNDNGLPPLGILLGIIGAGAFIALFSILFCSFRKRKGADCCSISKDGVI
ncbi:uncharacterized protein LOC125242808 isoform X2 [Megalobrama amblycephala]|uniref:uncharacterized protein LOC125242808 isoform X2 n=1 Tax=Megalobrama amblycephala TaxID=75352 RepID=UPI0020140468|nr:uncharacterized protein LOC125242808 isoform X2 [Megalobrama amblycephala]